MIQETAPSSAENAPPFSPDLVGAAGLIALLSASCCVLPIGLSILGLGGAWLSMLGPFGANRFGILVLVGLILVWASGRFIRQSPCRRARARTVFVSGFALLAFAVAATAPLWEVPAQRAMWALWREARQ